MELKALSAQSYLKDVTKGEFLFREGDDADFLYGILLGQIQILNQNRMGKEVILKILESGNVAGVIGVINQGQYTFSCLAGTDCQILKIPTKPLMAIVQTNGLLSTCLMKLLTERLKESNCMMCALSIDDVEKRIACVLFKSFVHLDHGKNSAPTFQFTRQNIADMAATTVESTIRILKKWEKRNMIAFPARGTVQLTDLPKIREMAEISFSSCCENTIAEKKLESVLN